MIHTISLHVTTTSSKDHDEVVRTLTESAAVLAPLHQSVSVTSVDVSQPYDGPEEDPFTLLQLYRAALSDNGISQRTIDQVLKAMRDSNLTIRAIS